MKYALFLGVFVSLGFAFFALPSLALAHPGHLGAITHLGPRTITLSIAAAAIDSFNPTALGVLLLLIKAHQKISKDVFGVIRVGVLYIVGIVITYLAAGYGINQLLIQSGPSVVTESFQILLAFLLFMAGVHEIDSAFQKREWVPWAGKLVDLLLEKIQPATSNIWPFFLGILFGVLELFLTGAIYLSFIRGITFDPTTHAGVLAAFISIYLFVFVLPLLLAVYFFAISGIFSGAKEGTATVKGLRVLIGIVLIGVAIWLTIGSINILRTL